MERKNVIIWSTIVFLNTDTNAFANSEDSDQNETVISLILVCTETYKCIIRQWILKLLDLTFLIVRT